ncbi:intein-containing adenosylcobalamin-dependent ribonucleoside-diphosphate reductase, partial [bacterium]|nr:intein-containing adenosylcobalamin-dependent ribonucleoside-diphosphate reductase [bacterium]
MGVKKVIKREGNLQDFDEKRIENAIKKAMLATNTYDEKKLRKCVNYVVRVLNERYGEEKYPHVEEIQDIVEFSLMKFGLFETAKAFVLYRKERKRIREEKKKILEKDSLDEVDKVFSVNALRVLASRYLLKNQEGKLIESPKQMFQRVAMLVVIPDILYDSRIYDKEGKQPVHDAEEFNAEEHEHKVGLGRREEGFEVTWNRWHLKRMKALYDDLNREGKMKVSWSEFFRKLSNGEFDSYYENFMTYYNLMVGKKFLPNSPTLFNAGAQLSQLSACFVLPIEANMESIMKAARDAAFIFKTGGGVGINYSALRPEGDIVASTSGVASGPISFMKIIDTITDVIKQGGKRRGANMGILEIWHPDIEKFITLKSVEGTFENFNISVMLNDEFFEKLERKEKFSLINPRTGKVVKRIDPRYLLELIAQNAWKSGDPGVLFLDNINRHNVMREYLGEIRSTNPCVTGDTLILTDHGLIRARNLKKGMRVWTLEGWRKIEKVMDNGVKPVYEIETINGIKLRATPEHKILTADGWKEVRELTENDKIRVVTEVPDEYPNCKLDKHAEDFIEFFGAWAGGGIASVSNYACVHAVDDYSLVPQFHPVADNLFEHAFVAERGEQYVTDAREKQFADMVREIFNIEQNTEKRIPEFIFTLPKKLQASFLRGLFSADGSVYCANGSVTISLSSTSRKLLEETQILLLSLGIFSRLTKERKGETKIVKGKEHKVSSTWRLVINGYDAYKFYRVIGFLGSKKDKIKNLFNTRKFYEKPATRDRNRESKIWVKIKKVKFIGKERVYDITAPPTFTWITNGIYSYDCGEQPLYPYDSCNLGSVNLYAFVKEKENGEKVFDWEEYDKTVKLCYRFLDNIIDVNDFPLREIKERNRNLRNVGLGMMGLADVLYALKIPYHSEEGFRLMREFAEHLTYYAMKESVERAKERGVFKLFDKSGYVKGEMPVEGFYRKEEW